MLQLNSLPASLDFQTKSAFVRQVFCNLINLAKELFVGFSGIQSDLVGFGRITLYYFRFGREG